MRFDVRYVNIPLVGLHNFSNHESERILRFVNVILGCTSKFLAIN